MSKEAFLDSKYQSKIKRELIKTEKDIAFTPGKNSKTNSLSKENKKNRNYYQIVNQEYIS